MSLCCQDIKCHQAEQINSFTHSSLSHPYCILNQALKTILIQTFVENIFLYRKTERVVEVMVTMKSCNQFIYNLRLTYYFCRLYLGFNIHECCVQV